VVAVDGTQEHLARITGANDQTLFWCLGMIFLVPLAKEPNRNARASDHCAAPVRIFYVGLGSVEQHIERVRRRVARGGHDIPEERIRVRYDNSRKNLVKLLPYLAELVAFDNTTEADPTAGQKPQPRKIPAGEGCPDRVRLPARPGARLVQADRPGSAAPGARPRRLAAHSGRSTGRP
jgi:hypothetical protein